MTALIGYTTLIVLVFMLLRGKMSPITVFGTIPVIGALLLMASPAEISEWIGSGLNSVWKTAVLFIFSVEFFGIMSDVGMFDVLVNRLIKMAGKNVILVAVATALVAVVGHLDGSNRNHCFNHNSGDAAALEASENETHRPSFHPRNSNGCYESRSMGRPNRQSCYRTEYGCNRIMASYFTLPGCMPAHYSADRRFNRPD